MKKFLFALAMLALTEGIQAGVGLNCRLAKLIWLNFDLAYTHGLLNVNRNNSTFEPQNRLVNINLGVAFGF